MEKKKKARICYFIVNKVIWLSGTYNTDIVNGNKCFIVAFSSISPVIFRQFVQRNACASSFLMVNNFLILNSYSKNLIYYIQSSQKWHYSILSVFWPTYNNGSAGEQCRTGESTPSLSCRVVDSFNHFFLFCLCCHGKQNWTEFLGSLFIVKY